MTEVESFILEAEAILNIVSDGYSKTTELSQALSNLEEKRRVLFDDDEEWPGFALVRRQDAYHLAVRHPVVDDYRDAWIFDHEPLSKDDDNELKAILARTISAWIDSAKLLAEKDKGDTKDDTPKKQNKRRSLNNHAIDCIRRHKNDKLNQPMKTHVEEYVEDTGNSTVGGIMRILNDHPEEWKDDTKTT